jgi:phosphomannomutase
MGGATTGIAAGVLARAGYDVVSLTDHIDPDFAARSPNPAQDANLQPLIDRVVAEQADLGIALDGDGDRVIFVDAAGRIARPEQIGVLLSRGCYEQPTVVYDLKCASVLARAVEAVGGTAIMCPSGHGFIRSLMLQRQADLGVEVSGHHFFGALGGGDDGLLTALVVCRLLTAAGLPLARLLAAIGWPAITPDLRIPFRGDAASLLEQIAASCGGQVSRLDGVRARYEDGWALARGSITEPAVTLRFEGGDRRRVTDIAERFLAGVPELRQRVLSLLDFPGRDRVPEDGE